MPRKINNGILYFPIEINLFNDRKIRRLVRHSGDAAFTVYLRMICDIYASGYWLEANENFIFDMAELSQLSEEELSELLDVMVRFELFDAMLYREHQVLTSETIQKQYFSVKNKRTVQRLFAENRYILLSPESLDLNDSGNEKDEADKDRVATDSKKAAADLKKKATDLKKKAAENKNRVSGNENAVAGNENADLSTKNEVLGTQSKSKSKNKSESKSESKKIDAIYENKFSSATTTTCETAEKSELNRELNRQLNAESNPKKNPVPNHKLNPVQNPELNPVLNPANQNPAETENLSAIPDSERYNEKASQTTEYASDYPHKPIEMEEIAYAEEVLTDRAAVQSVYTARIDQAAQSASPAPQRYKTFAESARLFREHKLGSEAWQSHLVRGSGMGTGILALVPEALNSFDAHIGVNGDEHSIRNENEYARRFINWWRCLEFRSAHEIDNLTAEKRKRREQARQRAEKGHAYSYSQPAAGISRIEALHKNSREAFKMAKQIINNNSWQQ